MSSIPDELSYTKEHEWVAGLDDGLTVTVGITAYAAEQLGDVVFVQLPEVGRQVEAGEAIAEVESTKSVSDIYAPVGGEIVAVNTALDEDPSLVNSNPYADGWLFEMRSNGATEDLITAEEYATLISGDS